MTHEILSSEATPEEENGGLDITLRPKDLKEFIGQSKLKRNLGVFIQAARKRGEPLDHCLFHAPPGLGKTTLAHIMAREMGVNLKTTSGPILERVGDLASLLTDLERGDVLFIDEIHRLSPAVEEALYPAMEDFTFYINTGKGPAASSVKLAIQPFTLVGATTRGGLLTSPLRDRFGIVGHLEYYDLKELVQIVARSARILGIEAEEAGLHEVGRRSRGTPRIANRLLRRVRDFAEVEGDGVITKAIADRALDALEVDREGLDAVDRRLLTTMIEKYKGGPVGLETLAISVSEEIDSLTDVYEPFLIQAGFLARTPRGRVVTQKACDHLGLRLPKGKQAELF